MKCSIAPNETAGQMAVRLFTVENFSCSESVLCAMAAYWGIDDPLIPRIATPFRGGLCGTQGICGAVSGALMAIGLRLGRDTADQNAQACVDTGKALLRYATDGGPLDCRAITGMDFSDAEQYKVFHDTLRGKTCVALIERCCGWLTENVK